MNPEQLQLARAEAPATILRSEGEVWTGTGESCCVCDLHKVSFSQLLLLDLGIGGVLPRIYAEQNGCTAAAGQGRRKLDAPAAHQFHVHDSQGSSG